MSRGQHTAYAPSQHGTRQARSDAKRAAWIRSADPGLVAQAERELAAGLTPAPAPPDDPAPVAPVVAAWWRKGRAR